MFCKDSPLNMPIFASLKMLLCMGISVSWNCFCICTHTKFFQKYFLYLCLQRFSDVCLYRGHWRCSTTHVTIWVSRGTHFYTPIVGLKPCLIVNAYIRKSELSSPYIGLYQGFQICLYPHAYMWVSKHIDLRMSTSGS